MGSLSFSHILILLVVFLLLFGTRRIPEIGASLGKGIKEFKKSLREVEEEPEELPPASREGKTSGGDPKRLSQ